ncbi:MAG: paraquat-inducible protein A [Gammaproteobacteria bacterium]|jgi:paraquat-inducible protein A|nr:paraquat-inducible protein A [Gammaproteobacteria bacterium]
MSPQDHIQALNPIPENWIACKDCDLLIERVETPPGGKALCPRCANPLYQRQEQSIERTLALAITGLLLFLPANLLPVMSLHIVGQESTTTIYMGSLALFQEGLYWTALLVFLASIVVPLCKLALVFFVSGCLYLERFNPLLPYAFRYYHYLDEWGMLEVYMLGVLVSVVKLKGMASIVPGVGLYCFIGLLLAATMMSSLLDEDSFWTRIEQGQQGRLQ